MMDFWRIGTRDLSFESDVDVRLLLRDRRQHVAIVGRTGVGKSTLLAHLFRQEAQAGRGVALIDFHGDLAEQVLDFVPPRKRNKCVYINPGDLDFPIGFNVLEGVPRDERARRADDIVSAIHNIWPDSWGPRLQTILYYAIAALLDVDNTTLLGVKQMLTKEDYRAYIVDRVEDVLVKQFWLDRFPKIEKQFGTLATDPVLNKLDQVFASPAVRNMLGQAKSAIDLRYLMDNNYLVVVNLSKGVMGEHHAYLLGALLVASFGTAAMSRADQKEEDRKDFALIIDEFHNCKIASVSSLLSEARKYRLSLVLAHQYFEQLTDEIRAAVLGNVGTLMAFRCSAQDTDILCRELDPLRADELTQRSLYEAWVRLLENGTPKDRFLLKTLPPAVGNGGAEIVKRQSRRHFGRPRGRVEAEIEKFVNW